MHTDTRIEAFRQKVEHLALIPGQLDSLAITLARADELPALIARTSCPMDLRSLTDEQTAIGQSMTLRIQQAQLANCGRDWTTLATPCGSRLMPQVDTSPPLPVAWRP